MSKLEQKNNATISPDEFQAPSANVKPQAFTMQRGHWVLMILGVLCVSFIIFISIARSIQITTVSLDLLTQKNLISQDAKIKLSSFLVLPIANRLLVLPGEHNVVVTADGFEEKQQTIKVDSVRQQKFEIVLNPLPGQIDIKLNPSIFASALIDGEFVAGLPGLIEGVSAGAHELTIDAPLYRSETRSIIVQGKSQTENISISLEPAWGNLSLTTKPLGATVLIDGQEIGVSPLVVKVEEGTHSLSLKLEKFKTFTQKFTIAIQQELEVETVELIPADGVLAIQTQPTAAAIILNGEYRGLSPTKFKVKPNQIHKLQVYKAGFRLENQKLSLEAEQEQLQKIDLHADTTTVNFSISPKDAELIIDNVSRGKGSQAIKLNTLPHRISVRKLGFESFQSTIIPTKSSSQVVSIQLLTKAQHFWANIPDQYTTDAGNRMKLFKSPGQVKLGSSRRETGRRSNEVEYTARLDKHFYVSLREVNNKQFREFMPSHNSGNYKRKSLDSNKHPVANVSWQQAAKYCNWLSIKEKLTPFYQTKLGYVSGNNANANGYRLLTEVEWAWLARNDGGSTISYPWGSTAQITNNKPVGNFADKNAAEFLAFTLPDYDDGFKASSPTGRFPANHNGLFDIGGNVAEWVNDWYSSNSQYISDPQSVLLDPLGPDEGEFHVIRGGSWARGHLPQLRLAYRDFGAKGKHDVGFRIARYVGSPR